MCYIRENYTTSVPLDLSVLTAYDSFCNEFSRFLYILPQALESLRSKTASDLIAVKVEDSSIEEGQGEEEQAEVHSRGRPKKSKIAEIEEDDIKSERKASDLIPVQTSPCGRPMRAKAGINKNLEM